MIRTPQRWRYYCRLLFTIPYPSFLNDRQREALRLTKIVLGQKSPLLGQSASENRHKDRNPQPLKSQILSLPLIYYSEGYINTGKDLENLKLTYLLQTSLFCRQSS